MIIGVRCFEEPVQIDYSVSTFYKNVTTEKTIEYDCSRYRRYDYGYNSNGCREKLSNVTELVNGTL